MRYAPAGVTLAPWTGAGTTGQDIGWESVSRHMWDDMTFKTTIVQATGMKATGIEVPPSVVENLGAGKRPRVTVTLNGYTYQSTVAVMGGRFMLPLAAVHREKAGVKGGEKVAVTVELDTAPREVTVPGDLAQAFARDAQARAAFERLSYTHRKEHVRAIEEAKKPETRVRRIAKTLEMLRRK